MKTNLRGSLAAAALCALVAACGGGGGSSAPVTLPTTVAITSGARADTGSQQQFASDVANPAGLSFRWDFGDGSNGSGANPTHAYARPGDYIVTLVVQAGGSDSRLAVTHVQVGAFSNVQGLSCTRTDGDGWCWQHAIVTGHAVNDVFFLDATHAWAVGDASTILKSSDGGDTWTQVALGADVPRTSLTSVRFRDALHGMALSNGGDALQTGDGGVTWTDNPLGGLVHFTANPITFADYGPGRIVVSAAYPGGAIASLDDGLTWNAVGTGDPVFANGADCWSLRHDQLQRMAGCGAGITVPLAVALPGAPYDSLLTGAFGSATQGLVIGYDYAAGNFGLSTMTAWSSSDGGATWTQFTPAGLPANASYSGMQLQMVDAQSGLLYAPGDLWAYWTLDGGRNWSTVASSTLLTTPYTGYRATGLVGGSTLWQSSTNHVSISTDRGATWHDATLPAEDVPTGHSGVAAATLAHFTDANNYVVAMHQRFYTTHDGGRTFTRILGPDGRDAMSTNTAAAFLDERNGRILTSHGNLLSTADGGRTWTRKELATGTDSDVALYFPSATQGWLILDGQLERTVDGGANWTSAGSIPGTTHLNGFSWGDATHAWAWSYEELFASADGGTTWTHVSLPNDVPMFSAALTGPLAGIVSAANGSVLSTTDGGVTWAPVSGSVGNCMLARTTGHEMWCLGSPGARSLDDGLTWQAADPSGSGDRTVGVAFADAQHGWAVTLSGAVLVTGDGGTTWSPQWIGDGLTLLGVAAVDSTTAWIVTRDGQVLATATGGW